jgi:hypothetical protein
MDEAKEAFAGWAIVELMGHRRLAGYVQEVELAGAGMLRLDVPERPPGVCTCRSTDPDSLSHEDHGPFCFLFAPEGSPPADVHATQFYSPAALYCLTPTTEETARRVAQLGRPKPVQQWELPAPAPEPPSQYVPAAPPMCMHEIDEDVYCAMPAGHAGEHGEETIDVPF